MTREQHVQRVAVRGEQAPRACVCVANPQKPPSRPSSPRGPVEAAHEEFTRRGAARAPRAAPRAAGAAAASGSHARRLRPEGAAARAAAGAAQHKVGASRAEIAGEHHIIREADAGRADRAFGRLADVDAGIAGMVDDQITGAEGE